MSRYKETRLQRLLREIRVSYLPNRNDNIKQVFYKVLFLVLIVAILSSSVYFSVYYYTNHKEINVINQQRQTIKELGYEAGSLKLFEENSDYAGWLQLGETQLNNPVYRAEDNSYYLNRNGLREKSSYGSLFMDYRFNIESQNIVIYGNSLRNGELFGSLEKLRSLNYYKNNSMLTFYSEAGEINYKIYAVFVLNGAKEDDGGYIYNIYQNDFNSDWDFNQWVAEAKERSIINTNIQVESQDRILTLVTGCDDFENSRLIIMARSERNDEVLTPLNSAATANSRPRYPKKWYETRNIIYPF